MKLKLTIGQIYFAFVIANVLCKGIGLNSASILYKIIMIIGLICVLSGIFLRKYTRKEILISMIMLLSGIMTLVMTKQYTFLITCIAVIGIKKANIKHLINNMCFVRVICFIATFGLAVLNIVDREKVEIWRDTAYVSRYGMGYGHPNILHLTLFIVLTLVYYCKERNKLQQIRYLIITLGMNIFVYMYSSSRTGFLVICVFEILIIIEHFKIMQKIILKLPIVVFVILMGFTYLTPILSKIGVLKGMSLLNGRVEYTYLYLTRYGYSLFGFNNSLSETGLILDNGYLRLLIETGLIGLLIWIYLNYNLMKKIKRTMDCKMAIIVTCFFIYFFTESFSSNIFMNYILFWGADEIFNKGRQWRKIDGNNFYTNLQ